MANNSFKFKQFEVDQSLAAMKVGTDGVLLGAWVPIIDSGYCLDIGTGTGLLSLMVAQRTEYTQIVAIDIDEDANKQSSLNFSNSKWSDRLVSYHTSLNKFMKSTENKFDTIVCNPPFFLSGNSAPNKQRAVARHSFSLPLDELLVGVTKLLKPNGLFSLILPKESYEIFTVAAKDIGLFERKRLEVRPAPNKSVHRVISCWSFIYQKREIEELIIETGGRHIYSEEYKELTKDFYLNF